MLTTCTAKAAGITPTLGVVSSVWGAITTPELSAYQPENGTTIVTTDGSPLTVADRGIRQASGIIELGAGASAAAEIYQLCLDGNWHLISAALALAASTKYWFVISESASAGSFTIDAGAPFLGLAIVLSTALAGGDINYLEIKGICDLFARPFSL